ncbi:MAG: ATP-dependent helicase [Lachnospiraceae bacterium]|nr:ATP-dependent helicase [Lachnospiraceae bacterium]
MRAPSKQQKNAIMHLSGPAQVIAGPGSGKTFTIIQRILYLVHNCQISPDKILVITYTKAAAEEMCSRFKLAVSEILHEKKDIDNNHDLPYEKVHFGTFHSICWQILRQSGHRSFSLISESSKRELIRQLLMNLGLNDQNDSSNLYDMISEILNEISKSKNQSSQSMESSEETVNRLGQSIANLPYAKYKEIKNRYEQYLIEQDLLDFDDMITKCLDLFYKDSAVLNKYQMQFQYILADEFQDINFPQYQILRLLSAPENNLFVVGDDDQAIYGFRGASPGIMKQFLNDYPQGKQLMLTENYRSGSPIVFLAKKMICQNRERFEKQFYPMKKEGSVNLKCFESRRQEEEYLIQHLKMLEQKQLDKTAVILRTNIEAMQYQELFRMSDIPVWGRHIENTNIFGSFVIRDIISFLSFIYNGNKRKDLFGFMNKPNRYLLREVFPEEKVSFWHLKRYYAGNPETLKKMETFWTQLTLAGGLSSLLAISLFRGALGYDRYLEEKAANSAQKMQWIRLAKQAQELFRDYVPGNNVNQFVREKEKNTTLLKKDITGNDGVHICTMHGSKGLEFERVFLPDVNEGIIPGKRCTTKEALEEERRLLYVAITRAEKELEILYTKERGRTISRYLNGLIPLRQ